MRLRKSTNIEKHILFGICGGKRKSDYISHNDLPKGHNDNLGQAGRAGQPGESAKLGHDDTCEGHNDKCLNQQSPLHRVARRSETNIFLCHLAWFAHRLPVSKGFALSKVLSAEIVRQSTPVPFTGL